MLRTVSWREDASRAAVEANFTFYDPEGWARKVLAPGTWLVMKVMDPLTQKWIRPAMHFYVWERGLTDRLAATTTVTSFDIASFLQRTGSRTWVFKDDNRHPGGWTASQIATAVFREHEIPHRITKTKFKIPFVRLEGTPLEIITAAYTEDRINTGVRYRIRAIGRVMYITRLVSQSNTWEISESTNLKGAEWSESLEGVATDVRAVSLGDNRIPQKSVRVVHPNIRRYGRITETIQYDQANVYSYKRLEQLARARLQKVKRLRRTARVSAEGIPTIRATDALVIADRNTGLKGKFFVDAVDHMISAGEHNMDIDLSWVAIVPARRLTEEEKTEQLQAEEVVTFGPDGRPVVVGDISEIYPEAATIAPVGQDDFTTNLEGVQPHVVQFYRELITVTPGGQYCISGLRPGSTVAGTGRPSNHRYGLAVDIAAHDLRNAGSTSATSPSLDLLAKIACDALGLPRLPASGGAVSNNRGTVIWKSFTGGNHYDHVHVDVKDGSQPIVPGVSSPGGGNPGGTGPTPGGGTPSTGGQSGLAAQVSPKHSTTKPTAGRSFRFGSYNTMGLNAVCRWARAAGDPIAFIITAMIETGNTFNPAAVGDNGTSFGLFQCNINGRMATYRMTQTQALDADANAKASADEFRTFYNRGLRQAELAIAAQRPSYSLRPKWRNEYFPQYLPTANRIWSTAVSQGY
jgi:hypothetical protein